MADPLTYQKFIAIHGSAGNVPIYVRMPDGSIKIQTLHEYWSDVYDRVSAKEWEEVFREKNDEGF